MRKVTTAKNAEGIFSRDDLAIVGELLTLIQSIDDLLATNAAGPKERQTLANIRQRTYANLASFTLPLPANLSSLLKLDGKELSGAAWVSKFPGSRETSTLLSPFKEDVEKFITSMKDAKMSISIGATFRPKERAYLMHYAWLIARGDINPEDVPEEAGVNIEWVHRDKGGQTDLKKSKSAAAEMVAGYGIRYLPVLQSRHEEGRAIDMTISWSGDKTIKNASGEEVAIKGEPRNGTHTDLAAVGATYGVIKLVDDPPHWSDDGA
ncbi:hypothetical protein [Bradyrhizobium sp. TM102]|uniref:hypothetical protein n=1 Tax=Bradyrhizobium sp. TM102 TaxID=2599819 RepID=UPI0018DA0DAD|nr:hypothetical protein [Bradyrhizobium sp. TM102]